jgi:hypothetical protein
VGWGRDNFISCVHGSNDNDPAIGRSSASKPMSKNQYLSLQANIICLLSFLVGMTALIEHPEWFR